MSNRTVYIKNLDDFIERIVIAGFTYRELARKADSNPTSISLLAKGERNPSPKLAINICKALQKNTFYYKISLTLQKCCNKIVIEKKKERG